MYLSQLDVEGFRSLSGVSISLGRDVTVLVGENNGGKSNVIDALRLLTDPMDGRRNLYLDREDVFRGPGPGRWRCGRPTPGRRRTWPPYQHAASPELDRCCTRCAGRHRDRASSADRSTGWPAAARIRATRSRAAGTGCGMCTSRRCATPPAISDRAPAPRIQAILDSLLTGPEPVRDASGAAIDEARLLDFVRSRFGEVEAHPVITAATGRISTRLSRLTSGAYEQSAGLGFAATSVQALARALRVRMADAGLVPREIAESGMGYANLLFIATVLAQLDAAREADLTLLLVEEPEAHLHPPLQALLLDYLRDAAAASRAAPPAGRWRGYLQVVITSHAPSLAASADVADLVVLQRKAAALPPPAAAAATRPPSSDAPAGAARSGCGRGRGLARYETAAINIAALGLPEADRRKLNRYLNATRSAMLFSPRVMLVEGIAEALVLPPMATTLFPPGSIERARFVGHRARADRRRGLRPYLRVLLTAADGHRIGQRVAVITDADTQNPHRTGAGRIAEITTLITDLGCPRARRRVHRAHHARTGTAGCRQRRRGVGGLGRAAAPGMGDREGRRRRRRPGGRTAAFAPKLKDADLRKGDFAQDFLDAAETAGAPLRVPAYLESALRWLTAGPAPAPGS